MPGAYRTTHRPTPRVLRLHYQRQMLLDLLLAPAPRPTPAFKHRARPLSPIAPCQSTTPLPSTSRACQSVCNLGCGMQAAGSTVAYGSTVDRRGRDPAHRHPLYPGAVPCCNCSCCTLRGVHAAAPLQHLAHDSLALSRAAAVTRCRECVPQPPAPPQHSAAPRMLTHSPSVTPSTHRRRACYQLFSVGIWVVDGAPHQRQELQAGCGVSSVSRWARGQQGSTNESHRQHAGGRAAKGPSRFCVSPAMR